MKPLRSLRVVIATILLSFNSIIHVAPLLLVAIASSWIDVNSWMLDHLTDAEIVVTGLPDTMPEGHFLLPIWHPASQTGKAGGGAHRQDHH